MSLVLWQSVKWLLLMLMLSEKQCELVVHLLTGFCVENTRLRAKTMFFGAMC